jgi:hypothetical protein
MTATLARGHLRHQRMSCPASGATCCHRFHRTSGYFDPMRAGTTL